MARQTNKELRSHKRAERAPSRVEKGEYNNRQAPRSKLTTILLPEKAIARPPDDKSRLRRRPVRTGPESTSPEAEARRRRRHFRDAQFSHTPYLSERLDYQFGPSLKKASPVSEMLSPDVTAEEAVSAVRSIENVEMDDKNEAEGNVKIEWRVNEQEIEERQREEDNVSEGSDESSEDNNDPNDEDYRPGKQRV